jgi:hypothetical protein
MNVVDVAARKLNCVVGQIRAWERAGDYATNVAEELFRWIQGRSLRHTPKKRIHD